MPWNFVASQRESELRSGDTEGADLGVAVWVLQDFPRPEPGEVAEEPGADEEATEPIAVTHEVVLYELDLESDNAADRENDEVATLRFTIDSDGAVSVEQPEDQGGDAPTLALHFRLEDDPRDEPVPESRQVVVKVSRGDDPDYELEMGLRAPEQDEHAEDQVMVRVGTIPAFERPDRTSFENEWDLDSRPNNPARGALNGLTRGTIPDEGIPTHPLQTLWGLPIVWWAERPARETVQRARLTMRPLMPHVQLTRNTKMKITSYPYAGRRDWGFMGKGPRSHHLLVAAVRILRAEYERADQPFKALAARAATVLSEGDPAAINTYDNKVVTLGMGYAGSRLTGVLNHLKGTPCGDLLGEAFSVHDCVDADLTYSHDSPLLDPPENARERRRESAETRRARLELRFDVPAYSRYVRLAEHPTYGLEIALANVREFVEFDCVLRSEDEDWANEQATAWLEADDADRLSRLPRRLRALRCVLGIAGYLRHGTPAWMQDPVADVRHALSCFDDPSRQLAAVIQRYAGRANMTRRLVVQEDPLFGKRIGHFEDALRGDGLTPSKLDAEAFKEVIPCLRLPEAGVSHPTWLAVGSFIAQPRAEVPDSNVFLTHGSRRYDFGAEAQPRSGGG